MKKVLRTKYFLVIYTNINNLFEDYDLFIFQNGTRKYYASCYSVEDLKQLMQQAYKEVI